MTEHDGVGNLHHGRFNVQREQNVRVFRVLQFGFVEIAQGFFAHEHAVNDFAFEQVRFLFQHNHAPILGD